jgi:undecaprenyl-diphosphatase
VFSILEFLKYVFLGIIQGFTEVIPVSSSGHVSLAQEILQIRTDEGLLFLILINIGSLFALIYHFRKRISEIIVGFLSYIFQKSSRDLTRPHFDYGMMIAFATIPAGLVGLFLGDAIDQMYLDHRMLLVGVGFLVSATFLYIVRDASYVNGRQMVNFRDAISIGLFQMFGVLPGLSRNGITTSGGLLRKLSMETALVFSLLMSIPLSIGSILVYGYKILNGGAADLGFDTRNLAQYIYYFAAFLASLFVTRIALKYIFIFFRRGRLVYFSLYLFAVGTIALVFGVIQIE